ncbi:hypothetical protein [Alienimonas chondri]|uniref:Uncharacterized protein n=1 Tax=Alienimonas chondri TaxID=2681879 RepID=A0ABX1VEQ8_9PLAN|nr:hypothetical protein [Alienimonas chondri]NNJ25772.1 hypothetical protein [Alienimonas chondri]
MNAPFLLETIPDAAPARGPWLDSVLVGDDLDRLVAELDALGSAVAAERAPVAQSPEAELDALLGTHRSTALADGLAAAPAETVETLLTRPELLLALRTLVLTEGGPHWDAVASDDPALRAAADRVVAAVKQRTGEAGETAAAQDLPMPASAVAPTDERSERKRSWGTAVLTGVAGLALGLIAAFFLTPDPAAPGPAGPAAVASIGWGWAGPEGLPAADDPRAYLDGLADEAEEWFKKRPETDAAVAKRIGEFRAGCSVLILAEHPALPDDAADRLREKCRLWASALDEQLAAVEAGEPPIEVRGRTDETVRKLIVALRGDAILAA